MIYHYHYLEDQEEKAHGLTESIKDEGVYRTAPATPGLLKSISIAITRRYGSLRGPTSSVHGGLRPLTEAFFAIWAKKELIMLFWPIFGHFWRPVVTLVTFSSKLSNLEKNQ